MTNRFKLFSVLLSIAVGTLHGTPSLWIDGPDGIREINMFIGSDAALGDPLLPLNFHDGVLKINQTDPANPFTSERPIAIITGTAADIAVSMSSHAILTGAISGDSTTHLKKSGIGILTLEGDSSAFLGTTQILNGFLYVKGKLGGNVDIHSGGILAGNGLILGNVHTKGGAKIAPGSSIGIITIDGNYTQEADSDFLVQFSGDKSSLLDVTGTATLEGGTVLLANLGTYDVIQTLTFLQADGGVTGAFETIQPLDPELVLYTPSLVYDANTVAFAIKQNLLVAAKTKNQTTVATILDDIADPTPSQAQFLNALVALTAPHARHSLNQIGGQQHSSDLLLTELINRQFIRRMYDPLRLILNKYPCYEECYDHEKECCLPYQVDTWFSAGATRTSQPGGKNSIGFKMEGPQITFGVQKRLPQRFTAGAAFSYEYDYVKYNVGGSGKINSFLGGLYGLYRPAHFYILVEAAYGYSTNSLKRPLNLGSVKYTARSTPQTSQVTGYVEYGIDIAYEDILIQPFIGFEGGTYWRNKVKEKGANGLNLKVNRRNRSEANTRFGTHFYSGILPTNFDVTIDLAWIRRWTNRGNVIYQHFTTFGPEFAIEGIPLYLNSFELSFAVSKEICPNLDFFAEFNGEFWKSSVSYYGLGGLQWRW